MSNVGDWMWLDADDLVRDGPEGPAGRQVGLDPERSLQGARRRWRRSTPRRLVERVARRGRTPKPSEHAARRWPCPTASTHARRRRRAGRFATLALRAGDGRGRAGPPFWSPASPGPRRTSPRSCRCSPRHGWEPRPTTSAASTRRRRSRDDDFSLSRSRRRCRRGGDVPCWASEPVPPARALVRWPGRGDGRDRAPERVAEPDLDVLRHRRDSATSARPRTSSPTPRGRPALSRSTRPTRTSTATQGIAAGAARDRQPSSRGASWPTRRRHCAPSPHICCTTPSLTSALAASGVPVHLRTRCRRRRLAACPAGRRSPPRSVPTVVVIGDAGHSPAVEQPESTADVSLVLELIGLHQPLTTAGTGRPEAAAFALPRRAAARTSSGSVTLQPRSWSILPSPWKSLDPVATSPRSAASHAAPRGRRGLWSWWSTSIPVRPGRGQADQLARRRAPAGCPGPTGARSRSPRLPRRRAGSSSRSASHSGRRDPGGPS